MSSHEAPLSIVGVGLGGPVGVMSRATVAVEEANLTFEAVAAVRPDHIDKTLGQYDANTPEALRDVPIISIEDAVHNTNSSVVLSNLRPEDAREYERILAMAPEMAKGRLLVTNASPLRMEDDVALYNANFGGGQFDELYSVRRPGYIIAGGNCGTLGFLPVVPLFSEIGIEAIHVKTLQGWSGAGYSKVPKKHASEIVPMDESTGEREKLETELNKFLGGMATDTHANIDITADPNRGPWLTGHHLRVWATFARETSVEEIETLWRGFRSPEGISGYSDPLLPQRSPIAVLDARSQQGFVVVKQRYPGVQHIEVPRPMRVGAHVVEVDQEDPRRAELEFSVHNTQFGAAGGTIMSVMYARSQGKI